MQEAFDAAVQRVFQSLAYEYMLAGQESAYRKQRLLGEILPQRFVMDAATDKKLHDRAEMLVNDAFVKMLVEAAKPI